MIRDTSYSVSQQHRFDIAKMEEEKYILTGPKFKGSIFAGSIAEFLIPIMKKWPENDIAQIDAATGEKINTKDFLRLCLEFTEGLVKFGVRPGEVVVHACPNSINCQATALAVFFSGGILSPIDQTLKPGEIKGLLKQFLPKYIICERNKAQEMNQVVRQLGLQAKIIVLDYKLPPSGFFSLNDIKCPANVDEYQPRQVDDPKERIALISCSSGSTGLPKGVALSHYSLLYNHALLECLDIAQFEGSMLLVSSLFWISGVLLTIMSCALNQTRIIPKSTSAEDLLNCIEKYRPSFSMISPPGILFLVDHPDFHESKVNSMKCLFTGGSVLPLTTIEKVKAKWKNIFFSQGYGMTEVAGPVSSLNFGDVDLASAGRLVADTQMKIVDPDTGKALGPNKTGELRLKADRMMKGYYNNEEATKASFDENGWLKTGDLAYYTEEGLIYIVGRIKEAIKYRNLQISLPEIENFILGLNGVADAAIVAIPKGPDYHLKAVVAKKPNADLTAEYIIGSVEQNFSHYKHLKEGVEFVDALPRSEVGKLKRWML